MVEVKVPGVKGGPIEGVVIRKLSKIFDDRGAIFHMLRNDDELFEKFGEIYFSMVKPGIVKGWHIHKKMILNYATVTGKIKLVLYDDRKNSKTKGNIMEIITGEDNYLLIRVPPNVWNGFKGVGDGPSIVANCTTIPYNHGEIKRVDPIKNDIPYKWDD